MNDITETTYGQTPAIEDNTDPLADWNRKGAPKDVKPAETADPTTKEDPPDTPDKQTQEEELQPAARARTRRSPKKKPAVAAKVEEPVELVRINFLLPKSVHRQFRQHCFDNETTITAELRQHIVNKFGGKTKRATKSGKKSG